MGVLRWLDKLIATQKCRLNREVDDSVTREACLLTASLATLSLGRANEMRTFILEIVPYSTTVRWCVVQYM